MIALISCLVFSIDAMAFDPKKRPGPKGPPAKAKVRPHPGPPMTDEPVRFWIETTESGDSPPQTTLVLKTAGGRESTITIGTYPGACSGRPLEGEILYSFDCFDAGLGRVIDFKHKGDLLVVQYSEEWEEGEGPPMRVLKRVRLPAGQPLTYGEDVPAPAAAPQEAQAEEPAAPPAPAAAPPTLKIAQKKDHAAFDALQGSKKAPLNLWDDAAIQETFCWAQSTPVFHGVRTTVQVSGMTEGMKIEAELWGTTKTYEDDQGYIECDTKSVSSMASVSMDAPTESTTKDIDILLSSPTKTWPCQMQVKVKATSGGEVLSEGEGSMGISCPE